MLSILTNSEAALATKQNELRLCFETYSTGCLTSASHTSFVLEVYVVDQRHPALLVLVLSRTEMQMDLRLL